MNIREYYGKRHVDPLRPYIHGRFLDITWKVRNSRGCQRDRIQFCKGLDELDRQFKNDSDISNIAKYRIGGVLKEFKRSKIIRAWLEGKSSYNSHKGEIFRVFDVYEAKLIEMVEEITLENE